MPEFDPGRTYTAIWIGGTMQKLGGIFLIILGIWLILSIG
jgi:hypothetical protein